MNEYMECQPRCYECIQKMEGISFVRLQGALILLPPNNALHVNFTWTLKLTLLYYYLLPIPKVGWKQSSLHGRKRISVFYNSIIF